MAASGRPKWQLYGKRCLDLTMAIILLVILSPIFLLLAVTVKLGSKGPVLYRQERIGRCGELFDCVKFRTMLEDADRQLLPLLASRDRIRADWKESFVPIQDSCITPLGRYLRRSGLDELPQLINVLRGEMSLVGPRPILPCEEDLYPGYRINLSECRPGITGLWQVGGRHGLPFTDRARLDAEYAEEWSLLGDVAILLKSVPALWKRGQF